MKDLINQNKKDNEDFEQTFIDGIRKEKIFFLEFFKIVRNINNNTNESYFQLFPLLKLIITDYEMLSEEQFYQSEKEAVYENSYRFYKISRVKKILRIS